MPISVRKTKAKPKKKIMSGYLKYLLISCCLLVNFTSLHAQSIFLEGVVSNMEQEALEMANVIAYSSKDSTLSAFAITNYEGQFKLELQRDSQYFLKAIYLGYADWTMNLDAGKDLEFANIVLKPADQTLDAVTVVYEVPVIVRGDTIAFKADAFTTGKERKLKDVFEQLPGFDVAEDGAVKVNGKKVDKITVDGKEFFTGDTKLASNNIPAKVVDQVKVLRDYSDVSKLQSIQDQEGLAIDIQLKEDQKNITFGSIEAGGGEAKRYLGHANLFYFHKKGSLNFIGNANNIGEQVFTFRDLLRFNGGVGGLDRQNGTNTNLSSEALGLVPLRDNLAQQTGTKVGAFNFTYQPLPKWNFSGYAVLTDVATKLLQLTNRTYLGPLDTIGRTENLSSSVRQNTRAGIVKLQSKYLPNDQLHIEHHLLIKQRMVNEKQLLESKSDFADRYFDSDNGNQTPSVEQYLNVYYNLRPKHMLALEGQQQWINEDRNFTLKSDDLIFNQLITALPEDNISLTQQRGLQTQQWKTTLSYYFLLNKTNHLGLSTGTHFQEQALRSSLGQQLETGEEVMFSRSEWHNDLDYRFSDTYVGLHYKTKWGKLLFKPGLYWHDFQLWHMQEGEREGFRRQMLLPALYSRYAFKKSTDLTLNYSWQTEFYDAPRYARSSILNTYNQVVRGNPNLSNNWYQQLQLSFYSFNLYNFTNIYGVLSYQRKYNHLNEQVSYQGLDRISTPYNIAQPNDWLRVYGALDKRFKHFKIDARASMTYGQFFNTWTGTERILNESFTQQYTASIESTVDRLPIMELGFETLRNQYNSEALFTQTYVTHRPFFNMEISLLKSLILTADYEFNWYQSAEGGVKSTYDLLNAELYFRKPNSPWELKLVALNILNTSSIRQDGFSEVLINTSAYFIQRRYWLCSLKYEF